MPQHLKFDYGLLDHTAHRPWPLPPRPFIMTQSWHDLLFAHWPVDRQQLRALVPPGLDLDLYDNEAWLGVVPFYMTNVAPRGVPSLPWLSAFPELNVRTYVVCGGRPGVYFFSLDAGNPIAVAAAWLMLNLPYFRAQMTVQHADGFVKYRSQRSTDVRPARLHCRYRPTGPATEPLPGSLEHFLTERYCLYVMGRRMRLNRVDIHHRRWPLQPAELEIEVNTMADAAGLSLPSMAPLLHFARRQDVVVFPSERAGASAEE